MLKKFGPCVTALIVMLVFLQTPTAHAISNAMDLINQDADGQMDFEFFSENARMSAIENVPERIRLEGLHGAQPMLRMMWDLEDPSQDVTFPIQYQKTMNAPVSVLPDTSQYMAHVQIDFMTEVEPFYEGMIYLTHIPMFEGQLQLMIPIYGESQRQNYQMMTQVNEESQPQPAPDQGGLDIYDLDEKVVAWQETMGQSYYRIYPPNKIDLDHGGLNFNELMGYMTYNGETINPLASENYQLHAVYSTAGQNTDGRFEPITYLMGTYDGTPQVWVSQQTDTSQPINFQLTQNPDLRDLFGQWYYQDGTSQY
ncbi:DUF4767 domain-containing protein [Facklamia sp. DSM 111018]|uniref:DUF4767 domain-containing protein n=1 Tax=Facklamia lactis TaxID=2749967 RepID=A0ABS0LVF5_9LACT|nr:DUF4767 domain-containing protein [Facklamia lactis]MBG9987274.1 DUF4767 domain-containing protein [Facklamia lactis]